MTCKPRDAKKDSEEIAKRLFPERMVGHPDIPGYTSDADAGQRLFARQIIEHLHKCGMIFPWELDDITPLPLEPPEQEQS